MARIIVTAPPKFYTANIAEPVMFDLIQTLRAAVRELEDVPEGAIEALEALTAAFEGDLPQGADEDGGTPAAV